jgi:hypothetical protein
MTNNKLICSKFPGDGWEKNPGQKAAYEALNGKSEPLLIDKKNCKC